MSEPKTVVLQGEPGSGKSKMMCCTAINQPVYVGDIDRKIGSAAWSEPLIAAGTLDYWELKAPLDEENLRARIRQLVAKDQTGAVKQPKGWEMFVEWVYNLPNDEKAKRAGTIGVDSLTALGEHFKAHIMWLVKRTKYSWDQWNAYKIGWMDTVSFLRDVTKEMGKDLIMTVHERVGEAPGEHATGVQYSRTPDGNRQREVLGTQDLKIWASIDGAFGQLLGASVDEYYWCHVVTDGNKSPVWRCRVQPDARRALRTSFNVTQSEFAPDFKEIWK